MIPANGVPGSTARRSTGAGVSFTLDGEPIDLRPGQWWYLDLDRTHAAANHGSTDRIHLVVDGLVDEALRTLVVGAPSAG